MQVGCFVDSDIRLKACAIVRFSVGVEYFAYDRAGVLAAVLLTAAVVTIVSDRTKGAVSDISYKEHIYDAIDASRPNQ